MKTPIAGIPHRKPDLLALTVGDKVRIVPEPDNKFDPKALKVLTESSLHLGYIPRGSTSSWKNVGEARIVEIVPERKWSEVVIEA